MPVRLADFRYSKREIARRLDPLVAKWLSRFEDFTPPQEYAIPLIPCS